MASKSKALIALSLILLTAQTMGAELVEFAAKQSTDNIRYITRDGKFTYFQKSNGVLQLSTNYEIKKIISAKPNTQFQITTSAARKRIAITMNENYHNFLSLRSPLKIFTAKLGETTTTQRGIGVAPKLHLSDQWLSFFNAYKKELTFIGLESSEKFKIKIGNKINPYFVPQVTMISSNEIIYSDLNPEGVPGILSFNRKSGKITPMMKSSSSLEKLELCSNGNSVIIGQFGVSNSKVGSTISSIPLKGFSFKKRSILYESDLNDYGNIKCHISKTTIYFLKRDQNKDRKNIVDAASLDLKSKAVIKLTSIGSITQLVELDNLLLGTSMGKQYIIAGEGNLKEDRWQLMKNDK